MASIPQFDLFTPPSVQLTRDAVTQQARAADRSQSLFAAELKVASQKKSPLTSVIEGLQDGLTLADSMQKLRMNELNMRTQTVAAEKEQLLMDLQIQQKDDDAAYINKMKNASPEEKLQIMSEVQQSQPNTFDRNRDATLIMLRGTADDPDTPPELRRYINEEVIPNTDPVMRKARQKQQNDLVKINARESRVDARQDKSLAATGNKTEQKERIGIEKAARSNESALAADPVIVDAMRRSGVDDVSVLLKNTRRVNDRVEASRLGVNPGDLVIFPPPGPSGESVAPIPVTASLRTAIRKHTQSQRQLQQLGEGAAETAASERGEAEDTAQADEQRVEAIAKDQAQKNGLSWERLTAEQREDIKDRVRQALEARR